MLPVTSYQLPKAVTSWLFAILLISLFPIPQNFFISYSPKLLKPLTLAKEMSFTGLAPAGAVVRSADSQSARLHQLHSVRHPSSRFLPCCQDGTVLSRKVVKPSPPGPMNMTLLGNRIFAGKETLRNTRRPQDHRGRDYSYVATSLGIQIFAGNHQKLRERQETDPPSETSDP